MTPTRDLIVPGSGGTRLPLSCYQPSPSGAKVDQNLDVWLGGTKVGHRSICPPEIVPTGGTGSMPNGGWIESATQTASTYFTEIAVEFWVPNEPPDGQDEEYPTTFFWPGIESLYGGYILMQPVLQWNQGGSEWWTMEDFKVVNGGVADHDSQISVQPGDLIEAAVYLNDPNCSTGSDCWYISAWWDLTSGASNYIEDQISGQMTYAQGGVLEAYGVQSGYQPWYDCGDFPGTAYPWDADVVFFVTVLYDSTGADVPNFTSTQYPHSGGAYSGSIHDMSGNVLNCNFDTASGWSGDYYVTLMEY